jgi:hypothetical protein
MMDPVVPLVLALYGHPDSGGFGEQHCDRNLKAVGLEPLAESWQSCYWHEELRLMLIIYVDDFKMSGPTENLARGWDLIRQGIVLDPPEDLGPFGRGVMTVIVIAVGVIMICGMLFHETFVRVIEPVSAEEPTDVFEDIPGIAKSEL